MALPGVIVAAVVAIVLLAVIRFGLGGADGNRWALSALVPGFLLGALIDGGMPGEGDSLAVAVTLAAYLIGALLDRFAIDPRLVVGCGAAMGLGGTFLILGVPFMVGGFGRFLMIWLPGVIAWCVISWRLQAQAETEPRLPLVGLTMAGLGLFWIGGILDQPEQAQMALGLTIVSLVGVIAQWVVSDFRVGAVIWLAGGSGLTALALELVDGMPEAAPAVAMLVLVLFAGRAESLIPVKNTAVRHAFLPIFQAITASIPIFVAALLAFVANAHNVG